MLIYMARYEVKVLPLSEAGERINSLVSGINNVQGRLDSILVELPPGLRCLKPQISATRESASSLHSLGGKMGRTLQELSVIYKKAEQTAFGTSHSAVKTTTRPNTPLRLRTERTQGMLFTGNLFLPDWLQMAVLKYEQTK